MVWIKNSNGNGTDWKGWALGVFIAISGALSLLGIASINNRLDKIDTKVDVVTVENSKQDQCIVRIETKLDSHLQKAKN